MSNTLKCLTINILCPHCKQNTKAVLWLNKTMHIAFCDNCTESIFYEIIKNEFRSYKINPYEPESTESALNKLELIDLNFIHAMDECFKAGIKGDRKANDWKDIQGTIENQNKYFAKINRHAARAFTCDSYEKAMRHLAAIACDANILWHMFSRGGLL